MALNAGSECLGYGDYEIFVADGAYRNFEITDVGKFRQSFNWDWVLNETSSASLTLRYPYDCKLRDAPIWPAYTQLWFRRDGVTVWKGFITEWTFTGNRQEGYNQLTLNASDWSYLLDRRRIDRDVAYTNELLTTIYKNYLDLVFENGSPSDINFIINNIGIRGDRLVNQVDFKKVRPEIDDLAKAGVDWTVIADTWFVGGFALGGVNTILDYEFSEESFLRAPQLRRDALEYATRIGVRGNNDIRGVYGGADPLGIIWDNVIDAQDTIKSQAEADSAAKSKWDRVHIPLAYVDGNGVLNPKIPIQITDLVPGVEVRNIMTAEGEIFDKVMRLERTKVSVNEEADEEITVVFQPIGTGSSLGSVADQ